MAKKGLLVFGATGRMGNEILALVEDSKDFKIAGKVGKKTGRARADEGVVDLGRIKPGAVDVVIDFSLPEALNEVLQWCVEYQCPLVCGTTGHGDGNLKLMKAAAKKIPILWSSNMSFGVAALSRALEDLPEMAGFDIVIEEFHHKKKKDRPSGTALLLKKAVESKSGNTVDEVISIRGGGIFGIHKVHLMSAEETLTFEHTALNRTVFARGAVRAAKWLLGQKPGLYTVRDVL